MGEQKVKTIEGAPDSKSQTKGSGGKRAKRKVPQGRIYVQSTYNNTIITVTDPAGQVLGWGSAGLTGFKGSKKSTPYAAQRTMEETMGKLKNLEIKQVDVYIKGVGSGRDSAIRALQSAGVEVMSIQDVTPIRHGGVRPKKVRRV
ncbi:MAG: 30S ribosomal protein S11 [Parcubacteria group bacterium GW2011_GWA2_52_8]|nr:MAG: 30S ribosomal protein S11 [Parcubacteria group bacterium GW2011_GWA2_52_8]